MGGPGVKVLGLRAVASSMCPVCGGLSFRATSWMSATRKTRRGFECLNCGARVRREDILRKTDEVRSIRPTLPAPSEKDETWRPPSARRKPASGTFQALPTIRSPLKKKEG